MLTNCTDVPNPKKVFENTCDIGRAYGDECQDYGLLGCDVVSFGRRHERFGETCDIYLLP
jgi:hypothetical protein